MEYPWKRGSIKFRSREHALEVLKPHPCGWHQLNPKNRKNHFLFESVPPERRHLAHQRFEAMLAKWRALNPGVSMTHGKRASLIGCATHWAKNIVTGRTKARRNIRLRHLKDAKRYLAWLDLQEFKSQPISKRVKRLV